MTDDVRENSLLHRETSVIDDVRENSLLLREISVTDDVRKNSLLTETPCGTNHTRNVSPKISLLSKQLKYHLDDS